MQGLSSGRLLQRVLAMFFIAVLPAALPAQDAGSLTLTVISGDGAINDIHRYVPTPTIIEVRNEIDQPVSGATVSFSLPESGPSGQFIDGNRTWIGSTDTRGRVVLSGFIPNRLQGSFQIAVSATSPGRSGSVRIRETNGDFVSPSPAPRGKSGSATRVLIILGVGAAVALGSLLAIKGGGGGSTSTASSTSVSIGTISIGAPH
jgi:hypothetical protein